MASIFLRWVPGSSTTKLFAYGEVPVDALPNTGTLHHLRDNERRALLLSILKGQQTPYTPSMSCIDNGTGRRCRGVLRIDVRESKVTSKGRRTSGSGGCRRGRGGGSRLKGVFGASSGTRQPVCDRNQEGASSVKVIRRRGANQPGVAESTAQGVRVEVSEGGFQLDSSIKKNEEKSVSRRRSSLGPRRGPRRRTTMARRHTRGVVWAVSKIGRWWYRFKMRCARRAWRRPAESSRWRPEG